MPAEPVTAIVRRRVLPGKEKRFECLMQEFMAYVLQQPGHLGINVIRPAADSREYTILDRFATTEDRRRFTASAEYGEWMERLRGVSEAEPEVQEMGGLAFWFALPQRPGRRPPPRSKMACLTLLGVYPLSMLLPMLVGAVIPAVTPLWIRALLVSGLIVVSLTWFVMPGLTRLFEKWLFPSKAGG